MDTALVAVCETLANEFSDLPSTTVIRVVTDCAEQFPDADGQFVEQAARGHLEAERTGEEQQNG